MDREMEGACVSYFRQAPVWERLLRGFREKYLSYGSFSGTVVLNGLTDTDIEALEGFFARSYHGQKSASISSARFQAALEHSRFAEISPGRLLELYFRAPLLGKKEIRERQKQREEKVFAGFMESVAGTPAEKAADKIAELAKGQRHRGLEEWEKTLQFCAGLYNQLPYRRQKKEYLAVFAARLTGNPHAFDRGSQEGQLLYQVVQLDLRLRGEMMQENAVFASYQRQRSYLAAGILVDDVSNYAMLSGVRAQKKDGSWHAGMEGFLEEKDMLQVPLTVLADWDRVECLNRRICIVENPSVYAMLCETSDGNCAYMCMNGQPRLAGLLTLEYLAKSDTIVYYAGDLDPEGLLIAQKLSHYYKGEFHFWHMTAEDYKKGRSEEVISEKRLKMLERITAKELLPMKELLLREKRAGYQELIFSDSTDSKS